MTDDLSNQISENLVQTQNLMTEDAGDINAVFVFLSELVSAASAADELVAKTNLVNNTFVLDKSLLDGTDVLDNQSSGWVLL